MVRALKDSEKNGVLALIIFISSVVWLFVAGTRADFKEPSFLGSRVLASTALICRLEKEIPKIPPSP